MKKLLTLLLCLTLTSCAAQTPAKTQYITIPLRVNTIAGSEITLKTESGHLLLAEKNTEAFTIPDGIIMEEGRIYLTSFRYLECKNCFKRKIEIVGYTIAPAQSLKDAAKLETRF